MTTHIAMTDSISPQQLTLYYSPMCPFCHRVLDALQDLGFPPDLANSRAGDITLKNTNKHAAFSAELIAGGGKKTVPCLLIERDSKAEWMYESLDIVAFLKKHL